MTDPKRVIRSVCDDLRFDVLTYQQASKIYELAVKRGYEKKYGMFNLAAGSLYFYCKSNGKPILLTNILNLMPETDQEKVTAVYGDLKKDRLG